jgi:hypothetical protein
LERIQVSHKLNFFLFPLILLLAFTFNGCTRKIPELEETNKEINVFGVQLFSVNDHSKINDVIPEREPCIKGYEYNFDPIEIIIGYSKKGYIRKITTFNRATSMFSIRPGDPLSESRDKILKAGFKDEGIQDTFFKDWCTFTLLVDEKQKVFGLRIEVLD